MRTFQLILLCFVFLAKGYAQTDTKINGQVVVEVTKKKRSEKISAKVEIKSAFPGGDSSWVQSLEKVLNECIHASKRAKAGKYIVTVNFVSNKEGSFDGFICENDPGWGICVEVIRVLKKNRKWGYDEVKPYPGSSIPSG